MAGADAIRAALGLSPGAVLSPEEIEMGLSKLPQAEANAIRLAMVRESASRASVKPIARFFGGVRR